MSKELKAHQVADAVHVTIPIAHVEKDVLSTVLFNRLHNILQNSTLYFTFPSCRTSRFSHSLGTMHLAGELFREAILNAKAQDRKAFLKLVKKELESIVSSDKFTQTSRNVYEVTPGFPTIPEDSVYNRNVPSSLNQEERKVFTVLFQAIRFYGLLHDLGHPPFSHVTESALETLFDTIKDVPEPTARERRFLEVLQQYSTGVKQKQLHETASTDLISEIFTKIIDKGSGEVAQFRYFIQLVVLSIVEKKSSLFTLMHKVVDGDLDADRLDYTSRDLVSTGLGKALIYERIINTFTLHRDENQQFDFLPSIRSLYNTETFLANRFDLYRFGVFHHRVRKFDGLFKEALMGVALVYLKKSDAATDPKDEDKLLPQDISGLWHVLSSACKLKSPAKVAEYYSQWDDAWLLNILRQAFFTSKPKPILKAQLEEILSNKKRYWPLFKRPECFASVDAAFLKTGKYKLSELGFWKSLTLSSEERKGELCALSKGANLKVSGSLPSNFFLTELIQEIGSESAQFIRAAIVRLAGDSSLNIIHAFSVEKLLKSGIKDLKVLTENGSQDISLVSNIRHALETDAKLFPPFFVFILPKTDKPDIGLIRSRFGQYLFEELSNYLTQNNKP